MRPHMLEVISYSIYREHGAQRAISHPEAARTQYYNFIFNRFSFGKTEQLVGIKWNLYFFAYFLIIEHTYIRYTVQDDGQWVPMKTDMKPISSALLPCCYLIHFGFSSISVEYVLHLYYGAFRGVWRAEGGKMILLDHCCVVSLFRFVWYVVKKQFVNRTNKMYIDRFSNAEYSECRKGKFGNVLIMNIHIIHNVNGCPRRNFELDTMDIYNIYYAIGASKYVLPRVGRECYATCIHLLYDFVDILTLKLFYLNQFKVYWIYMVFGVFGVWGVTQKWKEKYFILYDKFQIFVVNFSRDQLTIVWIK